MTCADVIASDDGRNGVFLYQSDSLITSLTESYLPTPSLLCMSLHWIPKTGFLTKDIYQPFLPAIPLNRVSTWRTSESSDQCCIGA